jgi:hypothetical protein
MADEKIAVDRPTYGVWSPSLPAKGTTPQIAKVDQDNQTICAQGDYNPPANTTCDYIYAYVYNDPTVTPLVPPPDGAERVAYDDTGDNPNYDFSGVNAITGVAFGPAGNEALIKIALWAHVYPKTGTPAAGGFDSTVLCYTCKGRGAAVTDCG